MAKLNQEWTVLPHGELEQLDDGLLTVTGDIPMPLGNFPRRMTVIRLKGGGTAIWSAIPLDEPQMQRIEALGQPTFLIVPNQQHRLDAPAWKARYPDIKALAPPSAKEMVSEAAPVDGTGDALDDSEIDLVLVAGAKEDEFAAIVRRSGGTTLIVNDVIGNVQHPHGVGAWIMTRLMGFGASGPEVPRLIRHMMIEDKAALAAQLRGWADIPNLKRIVPSHGDVIADDPAGALREVADSLT
ncbi:hypothetical protein FPZ24_02430 [Sphingomonas panacisoli]|uniref:Methanol oxidase n=1 Tax=Sphingomonas panacisoli TaxID=1813879 RepID=A0A5B8LFP2_9SPHN|nr:hypothetical protein [Sphingomonas panacisoli]QDZ06472.1 hypothetical protein FPZ24_02430 [Sphingomonas panacisoli]